MMYIVISILMIAIGLVGILKSKVPKITGNSGFAAEMIAYFSFYLLVVFGFVFVIIEIEKYF